MASRDKYEVLSFVVVLMLILYHLGLVSCLSSVPTITTSAPQPLSSSDPVMNSDGQVTFNGQTVNSNAGVSESSFNGVATASSSPSSAYVSTKFHLDFAPPYFVSRYVDSKLTTDLKDAIEAIPGLAHLQQFVKNLDDKDIV